MKNKILAISLGLNVLTALAYIGAAAQLESVKDNRQKIYNYARMAQALIKDHYANGGSLRVSPEMEAYVDAYTIFSENDLG